MDTWQLALIPGILLGLFVAFNQHIRVRMNMHPYAIRYPDGRVYGGHYKVLFGVSLLWTGIGFGICYPIILFIRKIL